MLINWFSIVYRVETIVVWRCSSLWECVETCTGVCVVMIMSHWGGCLLIYRVTFETVKTPDRGCPSYIISMFSVNISHQNVSLRFILLQSSPLRLLFVEQCLLSAWLWILVHFLPWLASRINKGIKPYYSYLKCYTSVYWNYSHSSKEKKEMYIVFSAVCPFYSRLFIALYPETTWIMTFLEGFM